MCSVALHSILALHPASLWHDAILLYRSVRRCRKDLDSTRQDLASERAARSSLQQSLLELQQRLEEAAQQVTFSELLSSEDIR